MVQVLRLNNTSDILKHNLTFDEVIMTFNARTEPGDYYIDARAGIGNAYLFRYATTNVDQTPASSPFANGVYVDGVRRTDVANLQIPVGVKTTLRLVFSASGTDDVNIFSQNNNNNKLPVDVYDIKFLLGGVVKAHLDATKGTANDQSGNNNHFALTGGTWLDDGTGGTPTGADGSVRMDTKQVMYQDGANPFDIRNILYQDGSTSSDTKQVLYQISSTSFDMLQEIFNDGQVGQTPFDMRFSLYSDGSILHDIRQTLYESGQNAFDLKQAIYESGEGKADIHLVLFADSSTHHDLIQSLYEDAAVHFDTKQISFNPDQQKIGTIRLKGKRDLYVYLVAKQELNVPLKAKRELTVSLKGGVNMTMQNQNFSMCAGDTKYLTFSIEGADDLTGATITWGARQRSYSNVANVVDKSTGDGITVEGSEVKIKLDPADTEMLSGTYHHECELKDNLNNVSTVFTGLMTVNKSAV